MDEALKDASKDVGGRPPLNTLVSRSRERPGGAAATAARGAEEDKIEVITF